MQMSVFYQRDLTLLEYNLKKTVMTDHLGNIMFRNKNQSKDPNKHVATFIDFRDFSKDCALILGGGGWGGGGGGATLIRNTRVLNIRSVLKSLPYKPF